MAKEFNFDAQGTHFYLVAVPGVQGVLLALPDFYWCMTLSTHEAPSADYLRSKKACSGNRVDQNSLATWLKAHWSEVVS